MKTITIISEDRVGLLADISYILAKSKVNIDEINADIVDGKAVIKLAVGDKEKATKALADNGYGATLK